MDAVFPVAGRLERRPRVPLAVYGLATIAATVVSATIATHRPNRVTRNRTPG